MNLNQSQSSFSFADDPLSTDCYSVRLLLEFLQLSYQSVYADIEQRDAEFLCPAILDSVSETVGLMPILKKLVDDTQTHSNWIPETLVKKIQDWFDFNEILKQSLGQLRRAHLAEDQFLQNEPSLIQQAQRQLQYLDDHLCGQTILEQDYLLSEQLTAADLIVFPQVALAWDAGVSLVPFLHIRRWINRIRYQAYFIPMAGLLAVN